MNTRSVRRGHAIPWKALAVAVAVAATHASSATAAVTYYSPPAALASTHSVTPVVRDGYLDYDRDDQLVLDAKLDGELPTLEARIATAGVAGASGYAESTKNHYAVKVYTSGTKTGLGGSPGYRNANASATYLFIPHDPQNRPDIMLDLKLKMSASAGGTGSAGYGVIVCGIGEPGYVEYDASGQLNHYVAPQCGWLVPYSYSAATMGGIWTRTLSKFRQTYYNLTGSGWFVDDDLDTGVHVVPELPYLITVFASSNTNIGYDTDGAGLATVDPVLEPASVNPDVTIEFPYLADNPNPQPLMGDLTPEALAAIGLDPQPFVDLGFFDPPSGVPPSSDPPPPPPPATPKYWCSPGFWLNNAVSFGAGAWPVSERTYYDYNSTAGQLAGCPTASGNATLLQVLQNPSSYFGTQVRGAGFNCVGDYLSAKSGLVGTKADNNGVCSIDQFGRQIQ
ncbi:MAG TPA: hypothetical protein VGL25_20005 [Casimicrobiaceae bacterium]|jgi:hypothetical protein